MLEDDSLPLYVMKNAILITRYLLIYMPPQRFMPTQKYNQVKTDAGFHWPYVPSAKMKSYINFHFVIFLYQIISPFPGAR